MTTNRVDHRPGCRDAVAGGVMVGVRKEAVHLRLGSGLAGRGRIVNVQYGQTNL